MESKGQGMPRDKGVRGSVGGVTKCPSQDAFLQPLFYMGVQGLSKLRMVKNTTRQGCWEKGQILGKATGSMRGSIKRAGIWPGDGGAGNGTPSPCSPAAPRVPRCVHGDSQAPRHLCLSVALLNRQDKGWVIQWVSSMWGLC